MTNPSKRILLVYWLPVVAMLGVIGVESTNLLSSTETGGVLLAVANWFSNLFRGHGVDIEAFEKIHGLLRKAGHLTGYGILCALSFRAVRGTARARGKVEDCDWRWFFQSAWIGYALLITVLVASADEMHQAMLNSRTGSFFDVLIDGTGALLALALLYLGARRAWLRRSRTT